MVAGDEEYVGEVDGRGEEEMCWYGRMHAAPWRCR